MLSEVSLCVVVKAAYMLFERFRFALAHLNQCSDWSRHGVERFEPLTEVVLDDVPVGAEVSVRDQEIRRGVR